MKLPFSYNNDFFGPILLTTVIGHFLFVGISHMMPSAPQYAVIQAPSSVEVKIIKEVPVKFEPEKLAMREKILVTEHKSPRIEKVNPVTEKEKFMPRTEKKLMPPEPVFEKPVPQTAQPPAHGAVIEAKPFGIKNPSPRYPLVARKNTWEGLVVLQVFVGRDGLPQAIEVEESSGHAVLDDSALRTVQKWTFSPARVGFLKFASWVKIPIRFTLEDH